MVIIIQIKIALSVDKVRILIKILAESQGPSNWYIKLTFDGTYRETSPSLFPPLFKACYMEMLAKTPGHFAFQMGWSAHAHEEEEID